jgi:hypothetical protein
MFLRTGVMTVTTATRSRRKSMSEDAIDSETISKPPPDIAKPKGLTACPKPVIKNGRF